VRAGDAALRAAYLDRRLVGLGYWLRYARPTHRPHADLEKIAVDAAAHGRGVGRALTAALIVDAREATPSLDPP
jgi:ribosomal protein S18 acetylase RimI-like enzyme